MIVLENMVSCVSGWFAEGKMLVMRLVEISNRKVAAGNSPRGKAANDVIEI